MKVITRSVEVENQEFVLIKDSTTDSNNQHYTYYGTIPYTEIENGKMKRALNGHEMCIAYTISEALARRKAQIVIDRAISEYEAQGLSREEAILKAYDI